MRKILFFVACSVCLCFGVACSDFSANQSNANVNSDSNQEGNNHGEENFGGDNQENVLGENNPDLAGETIILYLIGDTEPPFTAITLPMRNAATDYVGFINDNGGIFGAMVELRFADTGGSEEGVETAYERFKNNDDPILMIINYGGYEESLYARVNEDQIPLLTLGLNPELPEVNNTEYVYRLTPTYSEQFAFFLEFVLKNWEEIKPGGAIDEVKVAYISWDNAYGRSVLTEEVREYTESLGIDVVWEEYLEMSDLSSTTSAIFNAEMEGATVVYTNTHEFGPANLLNDMNNLAVRDFFIVGGNNWSFDAGMLEYLYDPGFAEGFFIPSWYAWWTDTQNIGIQFAEEIVEANGRGAKDKGAGRLLIQGGLDIALHAIGQAILEDGFENISGKGIKKSLDEIDGYEVMKGLFTIDFFGENHSPTSLQMRQVQEDAAVLVTVEEFSEIPEFIP
jgi:ABC-type branched-subunit amino acid transport system substrate-binding protein